MGSKLLCMETSGSMAHISAYDCLFRKEDIKVACIWMISSMGYIHLTDEEKSVIILILLSTSKSLYKEFNNYHQRSVFIGHASFNNAVQIYIVAITKHFCFQGLLHKGIGYARESIHTY